VKSLFKDRIDITRFNANIGDVFAYIQNDFVLNRSGLKNFGSHLDSDISLMVLCFGEAGVLYC
jgi:hypothetical protein